jgi:filamentous hemagglutinin
MNYPGGGEGNVLIAVGNNATTVNYWLFDNTGNLRLPGNTFAVNYANGTQVPVGVTQDITSNGAMSIMTYDGNLKYVNYATVEPSTGNIAGGNISTTGTVTANTAIITTGNITTINSGLLQNGNSNITITSNGNVSIQAAGSNVELVVTSTGANINGTLSVTGNANVGNLGTAGLVVATGNVTGGNLTTGGALSVTGNANVGNVNTGNVNTSGLNVTKILDSGNLTAVIKQTFTNDLGVQGYGPTLQLNRNGGIASSPTLQYKAGEIQFSDNGLINSEFIYNGNRQYGNLRFYVSNGFASGSALQEILTLGYEAGNQKVVTISGNANVGNLNTTTANITTGNITTINSGLLQNGNSNITITSNGNVSIQAAGSNVELVVTSTGANITGTLTSTGKIGYESGSTVTQTSNRGNGVNINALAGTIVTVSASMTAGEIGAFSVTNNQVDTNNDIVLVQVVSPNLGNYNVIANPNSGIGGFYLTLQNISGFPISAEAVTIRFMVIKAPNA